MYLPALFEVRQARAGAERDDRDPLPGGLVLAPSLSSGILWPLLAVQQAQPGYQETPRLDMTISRPGLNGKPSE